MRMFVKWRHFLCHTADYLLAPDDTLLTYSPLRQFNDVTGKRQSVVNITENFSPAHMANTLNLRKSLLLMDSAERTNENSLFMRRPTYEYSLPAKVGSCLSISSSDSSDSAYMEIPRQLSLIPTFNFPSNLDPDSIVCIDYVTVTSAGGTLSLLTGGTKTYLWNVT